MRCEMKKNRETRHKTKKNGETRHKKKINGEMRPEARKKWGDETGYGKKMGRRDAR